MAPASVLLADLTTERLRALLTAERPCVALVPVGSVEPHGPHLPLSTDTLISSAAAERAARALYDHGITALVAPPVAYGVTRFAAGFAGAVSVPPEALAAFLRAIAAGLLDAGFAHVSLVNSHLEPDHDAAVRRAVEGLLRGRASVASPLTPRWARTLSPEFKSGACHAGRYETSIVLCASPGSVDMALAGALPDLEISLSDGIRRGLGSFRAMGLDRAYTGSPREASAEEGRELLDRLSAMIINETLEGLAAGDGQYRSSAPVPHPTATAGGRGNGNGNEDGRARPLDQEREREERMLYTNRTELPDRAYSVVVQMIQSQAYRELAAAQMFGYGLQFVPELRWLKFMSWHIREEMEHYEDVVKMYRDLTGESVEPFVNERLRQKPIDFAASWYELAMAQFLYDRGGFWQLREYEECSFLPYRKVIQKIIKEERGHQALGERIVVELTRTGRFDDMKQPVFEKWLRQGMLSFGRPGTEGARYAIEVGLRKRDPGEVMQDFIDDIKPAVKACGLALPPMERIGIEHPPGGLDLDLAGVDETKAEGMKASAD